MSESAPEAIPVTLLTGFLGSGKTTVLDTLLRHPAFAGAMVIVNEFGEIGLDHELIVSGSDDVVLLASGCMCCALRSDLLETLIELAERREAGELDFTRVAVETSGLADPTPILHSLLTCEETQGRFVLDGLVAVLDAVAGPEALDRFEEARRQAAMADLLLVTKTDLAQADEPGLRARLAELNAGAPILRAPQGAVDPARLVGLGHFDPAMTAARARRWLGAEDAPGPAPGSTAEARPDHLEAIRSVGWSSETPLSATAFDMWMELLMAQRGEDILRFKGLIHLADAPHPFVVHGVRHIFHPPVLLRDWRGADRRTRLVMIVRGFTDPELAELFEGLRITPEIAPLGPMAYLSAEERG